MKKQWSRGGARRGGGNPGEQGEGESGKPNLSEGQKQEQEL